MERQRQLLALSLTPGLGPTLTRRCLEQLGGLQGVLGASAQALSQVQGIGPARAGWIRQGMDHALRSGAVERELELIQQHSITLLAEEDAGYPALLRHIADPPPLLWVRGELLPGDAVALALVGARKCSAYGREQADRFAMLAAQSGLCVVSGGAYGVDIAAHRAARRVGGRTLVVLGNGIAQPYPADHAAFFDQLVQEQGGAVISELPMATPPKPENFPSRNRIISGLSLGVLVIEATLRSGAMITARLAAEEHHREVMAIPGRIDSPHHEGCHRIIREGWGTLVTSIAQVLACLGETGRALQGAVSDASQETQASQASSSQPSLFPAVVQMNAALTANQQQIVHALQQACTLDELIAASGLPAHTVQAELTLLQVRGLVLREAGRLRLRSE